MHTPERRSGRRVLRAVLALVLGSTLALTAAALAPAAGKGQDGAPARAAALPNNYQWSSSGPVISPRPDGSHDIVSVKDPTVVRHNGRWLVYMTTANTAGAWSLAYTGFNDWSQASSAPQSFLDNNPNIGDRYAAAPHVFRFAPTNEWYLVYQTGLPSFSTTTDPTDPGSWSAPRNFQNSMPDVVRDNIGNGHWLDFWVICDDSMCYLFSADDNGHLYRAETTVGEFPNGFRNTQIVLQDTRNRLFEGAAVYKVQGSDEYLLIMEAIGSDGRRYYRSFTANSLTGQWRSLADSESNPFARSNNVSFPSGAWTRDVSHGELIRTGNDQTMTIDPCNLQLLYQGLDPNAGGDYSQLPWRLGLATHTNGTC